MVEGEPCRHESMIAVLPSPARPQPCRQRGQPSPVALWRIEPAEETEALDADRHRDDAHVMAEVLDVGLHTCGCDPVGGGMSELLAMVRRQKSQPSAITGPDHFAGPGCQASTRSGRRIEQ